MAARVEHDLMRHVQRPRRCGTAVATVRALPVAGDGSCRPRLEVEPPNELIVDVAEI
jgi:hypothetical protein